MTKNNCEVIRRELDELMLDETCSTAASEHLNECSACREFQQTQTKLRRMVGNIGTVSAPPDFDFRLRARLATESNGASVHYWSFARKGFAFGALALVFITGAVVVRNVLNKQQNPAVARELPPVRQESPKRPDAPRSNPTPATQEFTAAIPPSSPDKIKSERPAQPGPRINRLLTALDRAGRGAPVISGSEVTTSGATAVIPIDASLQSLRVLFDDGRGNAKTISVPAIRFGSQRVLPNRNQFAQEGIW